MIKVNLSLAQRLVTIVFLFCMLSMIYIANQFKTLTFIELNGIILSLYGTHLSVILTFFFTTKSPKGAVVSNFKFILAFVLILAWNVFILLTILGSNGDYETLKTELFRFPQYAGFLIAAAIVWLFSSSNETHE